MPGRCVPHGTLDGTAVGEGGHGPLTIVKSEFVRNAFKQSEVPAGAPTVSVE